MTLGTTYDTKSLISNSKAEFDITQLVKAWKSGTHNIQKGFVLQSSNESNLDKAFYSSEHGTTSKRPYLELNYTPSAYTIGLVNTVLAVNEGASATISKQSYPSGLDVEWTIEDPTVATVDENGVVTGKKAGVTKVTATAFGADPQECTVYVTIPDGVYYLEHPDSDYFLYGGGADISNLNNVKITTKKVTSPDNLSQMWKVKYVGSGFYSIRPMHKLDLGLYADAGSGNRVRLWSIGTTDTLSSIPLYGRWSITYNMTGYVLKNTNQEDRTLVPLNNSLANGTAAAFTSYSSTDTCQRWRFNKIVSPPTGMLIYNTNTGLPFVPEYGYVLKDQTKSLSAQGIAVAVYSGNSIDQSVTWSSSNADVVSVSTNGTIAGNEEGFANITVSRTLNGTIHSFTFKVYCYINSVTTNVLYDNGYSRRYPETLEHIQMQVNQLQKTYLEEFSTLVHIESISMFTSLADMCPTTDINSLCKCGMCENSTIDPNKDEYDDGFVNLKQRHHKNYTNILLNIPIPSENTVNLVLIGHVICDSYSDELTEPECTESGPFGVTYPKYRTAGIFNFTSTADELRTIIHEFGHFFDAPDHYGSWDGAVPSTEEMDDEAFDRRCIYGEDKESDDVTNQLTICDGCRMIIADNVNRYNP